MTSFNELAAMFLRFLLLTSSVLLVIGENNDRPRNKVVNVGANVKLACKTKTPGHGVVWVHHYDDEIVAKVLHPIDFKHKRGRTTISKVREIDEWNFYLNLRDVQLHDYGVYACVDNLTGKRTSSLLSVVGKPQCNSSHDPIRIYYNCSVTYSRFFALEHRWYCNVPFNVIQTSTETNVIEVEDPTKPSELLTYNTLETKVWLLKTVVGFGSFLMRCNLSLASSASVSYPVWATNIDTTKAMYINYLGYISSVQFNITNKYNLPVNEPVICSAESALPVTYHIITNETNESKFFVGNTVRMYSGNKTMQIICYAKNGLNLEPVRHEVKGIKVQDQFYMKACEETGIWDCVEKYHFLVNLQDNFIRFSDAQLSTVCSETFRDTLECIRSVLPCYLSRKIVGVIASYKYLCLGNYMQYRHDFLNIPLKWDCNKMYVQQLGLMAYLKKSNKFTKTADFLQVNPPSLGAIYFQGCNDLVTAVKLYCTLIAVRVYGSFNASRWHEEFFSNLHPPMTKYIATHFYGEKFVARELCYHDQLDEKKKRACRLADQCYNMLSQLMSVFNFAIVYVSDFHLFDKLVCAFKTSDVETCVEEYLGYCTPHLQVIVGPLTVFQRLLCLDYRVAYQNHHSCFQTIFFSQKFEKGLECAKNLKKQFEGVYFDLDVERKYDPTPEEETELCHIALEFLDCVQVFVSSTCSTEAALLQRLLIRIMIAESFKKFYCYSLFSHRSHHLMKTVASSAGDFKLSLFIFIVFFAHIVYRQRH